MEKEIERDETDTGGDLYFDDNELVGYYKWIDPRNKTELEKTLTELEQRGLPIPERP